MPYTKVHEAWEDYPSTDTPLNAEALDQIEEGIQDAHDAVDAATAAHAAHLADTTSVHPAAGISVADAGGLFTATDVEAALAEAKALIIPDTLFDTKGDLIVASAADTGAKLAAGSKWKVLTPDSAESTGLKWGDAPMVYDRVTAPTEIVSTTAETAIYSKEIAAGDMGTNRMLRLTVIGDWLYNNNTADTFTLRVKFGGTTYFTQVTSGQPLDALRSPFRLALEIANLGAANSQMIVATLLSERPDAIDPAAGIGGIPFLDTSTTSRDAPTGGVGGIGTLAAQDTATAKTVEVSAQWSASSANNSFRPRYAVLELV